LLELKRIHILGFKSFCDRTEVLLDSNGVTAIVGPNGCGKSNISDAISWVLGEQSAKDLRGIKMEDVIFSGTRERKPTGMAEVSLVLIDPEVYRPAGSHPGPEMVIDDWDEAAVRSQAAPSLIESAVAPRFSGVALFFFAVHCWLLPRRTSSFSSSPVSCWAWPLASHPLPRLYTSRNSRRRVHAAC